MEFSLLHGSFILLTVLYKYIAIFLFLIKCSLFGGIHVSALHGIRILALTAAGA